MGPIPRCTERIVEQRRRWTLGGTTDRPVRTLWIAEVTTYWPCSAVGPWPCNSGLPRTLSCFTVCTRRRSVMCSVLLTEWCRAVAVDGQWNYHEEWRADRYPGTHWALRSTRRSLWTTLRYLTRTRDALIYRHFIRYIGDTDIIGIVWHRRFNIFFSILNIHKHKNRFVERRIVSVSN